MAMIEAVHIFDEHNKPILSHVYDTSARLPSGLTLLSQYLQHSSPQPSLIYLSSTNPPTLLHSILQDNLLFLSPSTSEIEPLVVLEYLHRVADALEEFLGSPLLASKITANYDIVSQVVAEIADGGLVCQGEANVLRDTVETGPGVLNNLLGGLGLPGASPTLGGGGGGGSAGILALQRQQQAQSSSGSAVPWRRSNVRHTNNELYVDIVEALSVVIAPSGRPLAAFANGSIAFTSKVSGVPDLILNLSTGGKGAGMGGRGEQLRSVMERTVFHPCVRLNRWKSDGTLSFVPPDGRFVLVGYEVDLLGPDFPLSSTAKGESLNLPASVELKTALGDKGNEFEARLTVSGTSSSSAKSAAAASLQSNLSTAGGGIGGRPGAFRAGSGGDSKTPTFEDLSVRIPLPSGVRKVGELRPSRGEAEFNASDHYIEWKVRSKDLAGPFAGAVLRATVTGPASDDEDEENSGLNGGPLNGLAAPAYDYDEDTAYLSKPTLAGGRAKSSSGTSTPSLRPDKEKKRTERYRPLMPTSATVSFSVKGWLASGLKVESLLLDSKKSKGLGSEVKPYKGVKYLTVSRQGVEVRC